MTLGHTLLLQLNKLHIGSCNRNIMVFFISLSKQKIKKIKAYGQLVLLGFTVTSFIPVAYQRHSL